MCRHIHLHGRIDQRSTHRIRHNQILSCVLRRDGARQLDRVSADRGHGARLKQGEVFSRSPQARRDQVPEHGRVWPLGDHAKGDIQWPLCRAAGKVHILAEITEYAGPSAGGGGAANIFDDDKCGGFGVLKRGERGAEVGASLIKTIAGFVQPVGIIVQIVVFLAPRIADFIGGWR